VDAREYLIQRVRELECAMSGQIVAGMNTALFEGMLTVQQLRVLLILHAHRTREPFHPVTTRGLAEALGVTMATLNGIVDRLITRDMVRRWVDPADRRVRRIELSERGHELIGEMTAVGEQMYRALLDRVDDETLRHLTMGTEGLVVAAREMNRERSRSAV
jgi:DNA-binding MarR family transcriptional regulator